MGTWGNLEKVDCNNLHIILALCPRIMGPYPPYWRRALWSCAALLMPPPSLWSPHCTLHYCCCATYLMAGRKLAGRNYKWCFNSNICLRSQGITLSEHANTYIITSKYGRFQFTHVDVLLCTWSLFTRPILNLLLLFTKSVSALMHATRTREPASVTTNLYKDHKLTSKGQT